MGTDTRWSCVFDVVISRIVIGSSEEESPSQEIHGFLSGGDGPSSNLSTDVVIKNFVQGRLNRKSNVDEMLVEHLLGFLGVHKCFHVSVPFDLGVEELGTFDDDQVSRQVDTPSQSRGSDKDLDLVVLEQSMTDLTVRVDQTGMMQPDTEL
ncbi:hypothetical protein WICPIJ_009915 [Wickerhamomyces pijperi]|uniref:Uncharacterized protein n=1 Tax=Wickerhamomyces pijperi TaxID=599730 RepID=A0A9P8PKF6_WICPI|nr:hypothetical protein WICPIJ_009915 [Wickerhamomyces pijperi]